MIFSQRKIKDDMEQIFSYIESQSEKIDLKDFIQWGIELKLYDTIYKNFHIINYIIADHDLHLSNSVNDLL